MVERRLNNDEYQQMKKLMRKQKKKQRDPQWCLQYFKDLQAETPRFKVPEQNI